MSLRAIFEDSQPIRAACFSPQGNYLALGTNSKALKICAVPNLHSMDDEEDEEVDEVQKLQVLFENDQHHIGSIYCVDWSRTQRLIATGSNDKTIKILVCPDLENEANQNKLFVL